MRFRAHETFYIRKGWLSKGIKNVRQHPDLFTNKEFHPMDILGLGSNMVHSLRYWLQAVGLTVEEKGPFNRRVQRITELGKIIQKDDPYMEETGTLWLLQYHLCKNWEMATSWYYFFNRFPLNEFKKEDFLIGLSNYVKMEGESEVSSRSLEDDFNCIVNTYLSRYKVNPNRADPEDNMDCPLGELGLLDFQGRKDRIYRKCIPISSSISPLILLACILDASGNNREISLGNIQNKDGQVGKIFNLDIITLMDILSQAEAQGYVKIVRTAGLDVLEILSDLTAVKCMKLYYEKLRH